MTAKNEPAVTRPKSLDLPSGTFEDHRGGGFVNIPHEGRPALEDRSAPQQGDTKPASNDEAFKRGAQSALLAKSEIQRNLAPGQPGYLSTTEFTTGMDFRNSGGPPPSNKATLKK